MDNIQMVPNWVIQFGFGLLFKRYHQNMLKISERERGRENNQLDLPLTH